ncbi:hypothetical protein [Qipengyuania sp.]|uniref:hypothetical protein n=1 Tax=Qipengyuania sp. TaxID=2004515 RepID=UPI003AF5BAEA
MPNLAPNKPVTSPRPVLAVGSDFEPGSYVFRLQVTDDAGNVSDPAQIRVTVEKPEVRVRPGQLSTPVVREAAVRVNPRLVTPSRITIRRPK